MRDLPLRRRLSLVILIVASIAILAGFFAFGIYETTELRRSRARDLTVLADLLARSSRAALVFDDSAAAEATLATLEAEPDVMAAAVYAASGELFGVFSRNRRSEPIPGEAPDDGVRFTDGLLVVVRPVELEGRRVGTIVLRSGLASLEARIGALAAVAAAALAGALALAWFLSGRLQRSVSEPVLALAATAREIAERGDFTLRAEDEAGDEVGGLARAFNAVLASLEHRERELRDSHQALSVEVSERRTADARVRSQLAHLELLDRITRSIGERLDVASIFGIVVARLEEDMPLDFAAACTHDEADDALVVAGLGPGASSTSPRLGFDAGDVIPVSNGLARCVAGELVYEPNTPGASSPFLGRMAAGGLHSVVVAPLQLEGSGFGVLIAARRGSAAFTSDECQFLRQVGEHVALATQQAELHGALQRAYDDLRQTQQAVMQQERLRALGEMASGIAHDINNAISPVSLYTEMLLEDEPGLSERGREYLEIGQRAVDDIAATVARLKEFYRLREPELRLLPVRLNPLVGQVIQLTRARWKTIPLQQGVVVSIEEDLDPADPAISGVESEVREALTNLIFNAVDAMPEGGTVRLRTHAEVAVDGTALRVILEVADSGLGMDEETRRRCLEPFFTTKGDRGTGLGLAMVYGTAQRHGGDIEIESVPGQGTLFRLVFPPPATVEEARAVATTSGATLERLRILAVDDDPLVLRAVCRTLEASGHLVTPAQGGREGVELFHAALERGEPFAAVITDLGMPHFDGKRVASAVKSASPSTPVLLLTGWGKRLESAGDLPAHVDRVLGKPPKLVELRAALTECVRAGGAAR